MKTVIIKIGTNVITDDNGTLNKKMLSNIADQVKVLMHNNIKVILISSGAIAAGKEKRSQLVGNDSIQHRQVQASIGQVNLMSIYHQLFSNDSILIGQILATKDDFRTRSHYLNIRNCLEGLLNNNVLPILNENDSVSVTEQMFTDNDELACLVGSMIKADAILLLTSVDGIMDTVCEKDKTCIIKDLDPNDDSVFSHIVQSKSPFGRGGMITKAHFAMRTASLGITVFIANGRTENVITDIILNDQNPGTKISSSKKTSPIKRWLAFSEGNEKGSIILNDGAVTAMTQKETPISILPIGINDIEGKFQKGDVVRIKDKDDNQLGVGVVHYDYQTAKDLMGKANQKPIIHYDHLWVDKI